MKFIIYGEPHPQGRPRATTRGRHAHVYEAAKDVAWKADARKQILVQMPTDGDKPLFRSGVPLWVSLYFIFSCPKGDHRKREPKPVRWHVKKRDLDNLAKIVLDASTGLVWADDAQISILDTQKVIGTQDDEPRVIMWVATTDIEPSESWR